MFDKEKFKIKVIEKYEKLDINDDFYNKKDIFHIIKYDIAKIVATIILGISLTASGVYAGVIGYNYFQNRNKIELSSEGSEDWSKYFTTREIEGSAKVFFKILNNYDEYIEFSKLWKDYFELSKEDFQDNYALVMISQVGNGDMHIDEIKEENKKPIVYLKRNDISNVDSENKMITTLVAKDLDWNNITFKLVAGLQMEYYVPLKELSKDYKEEDAIRDNCFVIKNGYIISNNKDQLEEFIKNCEQNIESQLRIVTYDDLDDSNKQRFRVVDLIYKDGKYDFASYLSYKDEEIIDYFSGDKIVKKTNSKIFPGRIVYNLTSENSKTAYSGTQGICSYYN